VGGGNIIVVNVVIGRTSNMRTESSIHEKTVVQTKQVHYNPKTQKEKVKKSKVRNPNPKSHGAPDLQVNPHANGS